MKKSLFSLIISSCEKYSDLWEAHLYFYNIFWPNREFRTYLVTDKKPSKKFDDIRIIWNEEFSEFSDRILFALKNIKTDYVLFTLDDYFLKKNVNKNSISNLILIMNKYNIDYCRLYDNPKLKSPIIIDDIFEFINLKSEKSEYLVNFYPGLWKKESLMKIFSSFPNFSPWNLEAMLTNFSIDNHFLCIKSRLPCFHIEDIVRKGYLLNSSKKFLNKYSILIRRKSLPLIIEIYLVFIQNLKVILPIFIQKFLKRILRFFGLKFYTK
jgi:hypothetical protein